MVNKAPTINDFKPTKKNYNYHLGCLILFTLIFLVVISFHIYAIVKNFDIYYKFYHSILSDMFESVTNFFGCLIDLVLAPFMIFVYGFSSDFGKENMIAQILEIILILILGANGLYSGVYNSNYDETKYTSYIKTTTYFEGDSSYEQSQYVGADYQAGMNASWKSILTMALFIVVAPISTIYFAYSNIKKQIKAIKYEKEVLKRKTKIYQGLLNGSLIIQSEPTHSLHSDKPTDYIKPAIKDEEIIEEVIEEVNDNSFTKK